MGSFFSREPQHDPFDPIKDLPDLSGKVIIVTGGNSGIGFTTVQYLARKGAKVYIAGRSEARVKAAIERLRAEGLEPGNGAVEWLKLDLGDPRKVKESAEKFAARETRLDVLVNNAGVMNGQYVLNKDGIIESMVTNFISPVVFTRVLLPLLTQTARQPEADVRIVWVSSIAMSQLKGREVRFRNVEDLNEKFGLHPLQPILRYAKSKLAVFLWARKLQAELDAAGTPITIVSVHPGAVWSEGVYNEPFFRLPVVGTLAAAIMSRTFLPPAIGAHPSVVATASPAVTAEKEKYTKGLLLQPAGKLGDVPAPQCNDEKLADEVWATAEALLKQWDISV
ncbi:NAD(P)-binding protein [Dichomitus squalens]|nr:NAD(P)-binding protein [Dichomitus squalens]